MNRKRRATENWPLNIPTGTRKQPELPFKASIEVQRFGDSLHSDLAPLVGAQMVPAAIVVDSGGRVASGVAIGEQNVRALLEWESVEVENDARSA